jgi:hypothetical protein
MRHMTHFCVTFGLRKALNRRFATLFLAQNGGRIAVIAKKPAGAGAYL